MVAIAYTDITDITPPGPRPARAPKRRQAQPAGDPLVDGATRLLSGPLHQLYAVLWRTGLLTVDN
jgi:hypothetical protein